MKKLFTAILFATTMMLASTSAFAATEEEVKTAVLEDAGLEEKQVVFTQFEKEKDDGKWEYKIDFFVMGEVKYSYDVDAKTGEILEQEMSLWEDDDEEDYAGYLEEIVPKHDEITKLQAKAIALKDAGLTAGQVKFVRTETDTENGVKKFEIEFSSDKKSYEYDIRCSDGKIIEKDSDAIERLDFDDDDDDMED